MNVFLWIAAWLMAVVFLAAGSLKLSRTPEQLVAGGMGWAESFGAEKVKGIGTLEVLAALALIVPPLVGTAQVLAPVAACGLGALMIGAAATHSRRKEFDMVAVNAVLLVLAVLVAWGRFGPHSFS